MRIAKVKTEGSPGEKLVVITSEDKPDISSELQDKWQKVLDLAAKIIGVPSGLITRLNENDLEVFLASKTDGNIFKPELKLELGLGWYCENVAGSSKPLILPNALASDAWKENNPSLPFDMISYMGIPIQWPDGEVFGTFCVLDRREHDYPEIYRDLLVSLREIIQDDLKFLMMFREARNDVLSREAQIREIHHRIKNHFCLLINSLSMQSLRSVGEKDIRSILSDVQSRIYAISLIHDNLYRSADPVAIPLRSYLRGLGEHLLSAFQQKAVAFRCDIDALTVPPKVSVACGLVLNELITNSLKHAFGAVSSPAIDLAVKLEGEMTVSFTYRDNGPGLPETVDPAKAKSLGLLLIRQSAAQLAGSCETLNEGGLVFRMKFTL